jgi:hypothetical protein
LRSYGLEILRKTKENWMVGFPYIIQIWATNSRKNGTRIRINNGQWYNLYMINCIILPLQVRII